MRWKLLIGVLVLIVAGAGVVTVALRRTDDRVQLVHDLVDWDDSCAAVEIDEDGGPHGWARATTHASIRCEHLGPIVHYARYESDQALRADVLGHPPSTPTCIAGREVLVDYLDPGQFERLCRNLHGDRIDAVSDLPEPSWDGTVGGMDRSVAVEEKRDTAAQARALRDYLL